MRIKCIARNIFFQGGPGNNTIKRWLHALENIPIRDLADECILSSYLKYEACRWYSCIIAIWMDKT